MSSKRKSSKSKMLQTSLNPKRSLPGKSSAAGNYKSPLQGQPSVLTRHLQTELDMNKRSNHSQGESSTLSHGNQFQESTQTSQGRPKRHSQGELSSTSTLGNATTHFQGEASTSQGKPDELSTLVQGHRRKRSRELSPSAQNSSKKRSRAESLTSTQSEPPKAQNSQGRPKKHSQGELSSTSILGNTTKRWRELSPSAQNSSKKRPRAESLNYAQGKSSSSLQSNSPKELIAQKFPSTPVKRLQPNSPIPVQDSRCKHTPRQASSKLTHRYKAKPKKLSGMLSITSLWGGGGGGILVN